MDAEHPKKLKKDDGTEEPMPIGYPTSPTTDRLNPAKIAVFPVEGVITPEECAVAGREKWDAAPKNDSGWIDHVRQSRSMKPVALPSSSAQMPTRAAVAIICPDNRIVVAEPSNHWFNARSFAMGGVDDSLRQELRSRYQPPANATQLPDWRAVQEEALRITAVKEAYEETGLQVELTDFIGDYRVANKATHLGVTYRLFMGRAVGGSVSDMGAESQSVSLVPVDQLVKLFREENTYRHKHPGLEDNPDRPPMWDSRVRYLTAMAEAVESYVKKPPQVMQLTQGSPNIHASTAAGNSVTSMQAQSASALKTASPPQTDSTPRPPQNPAGTSHKTSIPTSRWKKRLDQLRQFTMNLKHIFTRDTGAAPNSSGVECVEAGMVRVRMRAGKTEEVHAIHANGIKHRLPAGGSRPTDEPLFAVAGQSPMPVIRQNGPADGVSDPFYSCEKFLVQGIESGLGLFQFVSPKAHKRPAESREHPIVGQLREQMSKNPQEKLILGGRYRVESFKPAAVSGMDDDHAHWELEVTDLTDDQRKKVPVTQAGLTFTGRLLDREGIKRADALLAVHENMIADSTRASAVQSLPTIISYAGSGRNATLITYRQIAELIDAKQIKNESALEKVLVDMIAKGRQERGNLFVHSEAQIESLREALLERINSLQATT